MHLRFGKDKLKDKHLEAKNNERVKWKKEKCSKNTANGDCRSVVFLI